MKTLTKQLAVLLAASTLIVSGCGSRSADEGADAVDGSTTDGGVTFNPDGSINTGDPDLGAAIGPDINFELFSDATDIQTGGSEAVAITATLIDENRNPLEGVEVQWSATGGVLQDRTLVSDGNGVVMASLRVPQDFINRDIIVSVSAGGFSTALTVTTFGTTLEVQGADRSVVQGGSLDVDFTLTAGDGEPIANRPIFLSSEAGNTFTPAVPVTDQNGNVAVSIDTAMGADTITYAALDDPTLTGSFPLSVSSDELSFSTVANGTEFEVNTSNTITVEWMSGGQPVVNGPLRVSTSAGEILGASVLFTDANGRVEVPISSPSAGAARLSVQDATDGAPFSAFDLLFIATTPAQLDMSSTSTRVFVDEDRAEITALVRDANGNPVKDQEVIFTADDLRGGQLSPSASITNSDGEASTTFIAGSNATEIDAIEIVGTVQGTNISGTVNLSVVERRLNVTLGAGSMLQQDELLTQNIRNMVVQVADGSGTAIANASVSLTITPIDYGKGRMTLVDDSGQPAPADGDDSWTPSGWARIVGTPYSVNCNAEDTNLNRTLDTGEDINGNGSLDPQDPAVLVPVEGDNFATLTGGGMLVTDENGIGFFRMIYPKSNSNWSQVLVTARATALGTEAQDELEMSLLSLVDDINDPLVTPPNLRSPYGTTLDCTSAN